MKSACTWWKPLLLDTTIPKMYYESTSTSYKCTYKEQCIKVHYGNMNIQGSKYCVHGDSNFIRFSSGYFEKKKYFMDTCWPKSSWYCCGDSNLFRFFIGLFWNFIWMDTCRPKSCWYLPQVIWLIKDRCKLPTHIVSNTTDTLKRFIIVIEME